MFNDTSIQLTEIVLRVANHLAFRGQMDELPAEEIRANILAELSLLGAVITEQSEGVWHVSDFDSNETCLLREEQGNYHVEYISNIDPITEECAASSSGDGSGMEEDPLREVSHYLPRGNDGGYEGSFADDSNGIQSVGYFASQGDGGKQQGSGEYYPSGAGENGIQAGWIDGSIQEEHGRIGSDIPGNGKDDQGSRQGDFDGAAGDQQGNDGECEQGFSRKHSVGTEISDSGDTANDSDLGGRRISDENDGLASGSIDAGGTGSDAAGKSEIEQTENGDCGTEQGSGSEKGRNDFVGHETRGTGPGNKEIHGGPGNDCADLEQSSGADQETANLAGTIPLQAASGGYGRSVRGDSGRIDAVHDERKELHPGEGIKEASVDDELVELSIEKRIKRAEMYALERELLLQEKERKLLAKKLDELSALLSARNMEFAEVHQSLQELKQIRENQKQEVQTFCSELDNLREEFDSLQKRLSGLSSDV